MTPILGNAYANLSHALPSDIIHSIVNYGVLDNPESFPTNRSISNELLRLVLVDKAWCEVARKYLYINPQLNLEVHPSFGTAERNGKTADETSAEQNQDGPLDGAICLGETASHGKHKPFQRSRHLLKTLQTNPDLAKRMVNKLELGQWTFELKRMSVYTAPVSVTTPTTLDGSNTAVPIESLAAGEDAFMANTNANEDNNSSTGQASLAASSTALQTDLKPKTMDRRQISRWAIHLLEAISSPSISYSEGGASSRSKSPSSQNASQVAGSDIEEDKLDQIILNNSNLKSLDWPSVTFDDKFYLKQVLLGIPDSGTLTGRPQCASSPSLRRVRSDHPNNKSTHSMPSRKASKPFAKVEEIIFGQGLVVEDPWIVNVNSNLLHTYGTASWTFAEIARLLRHGFPNVKKLEVRDPFLGWSSLSPSSTTALPNHDHHHHGERNIDNGDLGHHFGIGEAVRVNVARPLHELEEAEDDELIRPAAGGVLRVERLRLDPIPTQEFEDQGMDVEVPDDDGERAKDEVDENEEDLEDYSAFHNLDLEEFSFQFNRNIVIDYEWFEKVLAGTTKARRDQEGQLIVLNDAVIVSDRNVNLEHDEHLLATSLSSSPSHSLTSRRNSSDSGYGHSGFSSPLGRHLLTTNEGSVKQQKEVSHYYEGRRGLKKLSVTEHQLSHESFIRLLEDYGSDLVELNIKTSDRHMDTRIIPTIARICKKLEVLRIGSKLSMNMLNWEYLKKLSRRLRCLELYSITFLNAFGRMTYPGEGLDGQLRFVNRNEDQGRIMARDGHGAMGDDEEVGAGIRLNVQGPGIEGSAGFNTRRGRRRSSLSQIVATSPEMYRSLECSQLIQIVSSTTHFPKLNRFILASLTKGVTQGEQYGNYAEFRKMERDMRPFKDRITFKVVANFEDIIW